MFKKILLAAGLLRLTGMLSACGGQAEQKVTEIRIVFNQSENHPQYLTMKDFGEKFEKATNSHYHMTICPNGALGEQSTMAEFIHTGVLQMAIVPGSIPEGYDTDLAIVGAPYLYDNIDHPEYAVMGGIFDELFSSTDKYRFRVPMVYTASERNVYARKPISSVNDLKGMIIRINDNPTYVEVTELMGGSRAVMVQSEIYTALQQGVIDAAENSGLVCRDFKNYEVAPYCAYACHIVRPDVVLASIDFLNSMSDGDKAIFDQPIKESTEKEFTLFKETIEQAKKDTEATGAQFCYPDTEELRERYMPLLQRIAEQSGVTKKIYADMTALREREQS